MAFVAALFQLGSLYREGSYILLVMDSMIIVAAIFVMLEAASALMAARTARAEARG
jgi:carbon starvation protein